MPRISESLQRFFHNIAAGSLGQVINFCAQLVSIPLFLHFWSKPLYGEWLVLTSIPNLLWCFEGGLAGVAASRMTLASAAGDWRLANVLFQNVLIMQSILCVFIFSGCLITVHFFDLHQLLHFSYISSRSASLILVLMIIYMIAGFFISLMRAAYRASAQEARGIMVLNLWRIIDLSVTVVVLATHGHGLRLAACLTLSAVTCMALACFDVRRQCPHVRFGVNEASWSHSRRLMVDGAPLLASMAANVLSLQGYPLLINRCLGSSAVVNLTAVRTVSRTILQAVTISSGASASELSRTYGSKDWQGYLRLVKIIAATTFLGSLISCLGMPILGPLVIREWTGGKIVMDSFTLLLFGIVIALQVAWGTCSTVLVASNVHHVFNYFYLVITIIFMSTVPYILPHWGFIGIPAVMLASDSCLLAMAVYLCHKKLNHMSLSDLWCMLRPTFYLEKAGVLKRG